MPIDQAALSRSLAQLTAGLTTVPSAAALTSRLAVVVSAAQDVLCVEAVGLLLLSDGGKLRTVATTGPASATLEKAQEDLGVGPGVDTVRTQATVAVADLRAEAAYAPLWEGVDGAGVRAVVSAPVTVGRQVVGNLNGMRPQPHQWSSGEVSAVEAFAGVVGALLAMSARTTPRALFDLAPYSAQHRAGSRPWSPDRQDGGRNLGLADGGPPDGGSRP